MTAPLSSTDLHAAIAQVRYGVAKTEGLLVLVEETHRARQSEVRMVRLLQEAEMFLDGRIPTLDVEAVRNALNEFYGKAK